MSKTTEYAIVPGESLIPGSSLVPVELPDGTKLSWNRTGDDFDVHMVMMTKEDARRLKDSGYKLSPDPREIASPKPRKKKTTKDSEEG